MYNQASCWAEQHDRTFRAYSNNNNSNINLTAPCRAYAQGLGPGGPAYTIAGKPKEAGPKEVGAACTASPDKSMQEGSLHVTYKSNQPVSAGS